MQGLLRKFALTYHSVPFQESFRFGDGQVATSKEAFLYPINPSGKKWLILWIAQVDVPCPGLLSAGAMPGMCMSVDFGTLTLRVEGVEFPLRGKVDHPDLALVHPSSRFEHAPNMQATPPL
jgi:hypothetical protein